MLLMIVVMFQMVMQGFFEQIIDLYISKKLINLNQIIRL